MIPTHIYVCARYVVYKPFENSHPTTCVIADKEETVRNSLAFILSENTCLAKLFIIHFHFPR